MRHFKSSPWGRRGFLKALGGAVLPVLGCRSRDAREAGGRSALYAWRGIGFGIEMSMEIHGVTASLAERLGQSCQETIAELESAFSLYLEDSELSRLNRERELPHASARFVELLQRALALESRTLGYCQPAIHGAWQWLAAHACRIDDDRRAAWQRHCAAATTRNLQRAGEAIRLTHPLTQVSMNAIGQGYLADRVASELRDAGVERGLLHLGETMAIGGHPAGRPWKLAVMGTGPDAEVVGEVELADAGLAVSANEAGRLLIDPVGRRLQSHDRVAAVVSGEGATVADAFATAFAVAPARQWEPLMAGLQQGGTCQVKVWEANRLAFEA